MIGRPGKVELSPDIVWRLRPLENSPRPTLLRTGSYNTFHGSTWVNNPRVTVSDFKDLDNVEPVKGEIFYLLSYLLREDLPPEMQRELLRESISPDLPRFSLRGTAFAETPLPLPGNAASLQHFELDGIESNSFGTVRIFPKRSVIEGSVLWNGRTNPETPPIPKEDLATPTTEQETLQTVLHEIGIEQQLTLDDKLKTLRSWFRENFKYSTSLSISSSNYLSTSRSALSQFLTVNHSGHCEYFATAAALLLREAGIPARYAIGYAVVERDTKRGEYVIRGTHGHAWCRVWDENIRQMDRLRRHTSRLVRHIVAGEHLRPEIQRCPQTPARGLFPMAQPTCQPPCRLAGHAHHRPWHHRLRREKTLAFQKTVGGRKKGHRLPRSHRPDTIKRTRETG